MASDEEILCKLRKLLEQADFTTTTATAVRQRLEAELGLDLTEKAAFLRKHIDLFLQLRQPEQEQPERNLLRGDPSRAIAESGIQGGSEAISEVEACDRAVKGDAQPETKDLKGPAHAFAKEGAPMGGKRRGGPGGLNKICGVSPELQAVVGEPAMPRTQIVKQLWAYIRQNNLQDPSNKRKIICDDALRLVFDTDSTDMFNMNKLLARHIWSLDPAEDSSELRSKKKKLENNESPTGTTTGFPSPVSISSALAKFFGTEETEMLLTEAVKRIWDYINDNQLQDPLDKSNIICDGKLQELFGCENFADLGMTKLLTPHFLKE